MIAVKTINWSKSNFQELDGQKHSSEQKSARNTSTGFRRKLAQKLEDLDAYWLKLNVYAEPKVWEKKDRYDNTYYRVYDFQSDRYLDFNSEDEVRWWLDKRYYL